MNAEVQVHFNNQIIGRSHAGHVRTDVKGIGPFQLMHTTVFDEAGFDITGMAKGSEVRFYIGPTVPTLSVLLAENQIVTFVYGKKPTILEKASGVLHAYMPVLVSSEPIVQSTVTQHGSQWEEI